MEAFRSEVRAALEVVLADRGDGEVRTLMGAGSDEVEAGRRFLAAVEASGLGVPGWPRELGGRQATSDERVVLAEELVRLQAPDLYPFLVGIDLVGPVLVTYGRPDQRQRWMPPIRTGREIWCQLFSEPDAGSDLANVATRAERDGDVWRVTGAKVWSSRAQYAEWGLLLARTDRSAGKHAGISAFGLDLRRPGVEVRPLRQMNGDRHFSEVFLDDVVVPDADRIGELGQGWEIATATLAHERTAIAAVWAEVDPERLVRLARQVGCHTDPVRRQQLAELITRIEVNRWSVERAQELAQQGRPLPGEASAAKVRNSELLRDVGRWALDVLGPEGVAASGEWQTLFLTGPSFSIRGGTDEIQRNILAERVLGLPREPKPTTAASSGRPSVSPVTPVAPVASGA